MNVKRFTARTSREALALVRQAFGDEAVVLSNKPCAEGVEVLAMAPEGMTQIERVAATAPRAEPRGPARVQVRPAAAPVPTMAGSARLAQRVAERSEPSFGQAVDEDVQTLAMSTLSFQDYVRVHALLQQELENLLQCGDADHLGDHVFDQLGLLLGEVVHQLLGLHTTQETCRVNLHQV